MKKLLKCNVICILAMLLLPLFGTSQNIVADSLTSMLVKDWERAKEYTQEYMKAMPADKYSMKATDSVRSFAQQMLHLAQANMFFTAIATDVKLPQAADLEKRLTAQTSDSVAYYVNSSYDYVIRSLKNLSPASLMQTATVNFGMPMTATRLGWMLKAFEHQTHHRGQTTIYIRLAGVKPPNERLF